jgi:hypothetical protein
MLKTGFSERLYRWWGLSALFTCSLPWRRALFILLRVAHSNSNDVYIVTTKFTLKRHTWVRWVLGRNCLRKALLIKRESAFFFRCVSLNLSFLRWFTTVFSRLRSLRFFSACKWFSLDQLNFHIRDVSITTCRTRTLKSRSLSVNLIFFCLQTFFLCSRNAAQSVGSFLLTLPGYLVITQNTLVYF